MLNTRSWYVILLTWVSGSWKTTLQKYMKENCWFDIPTSWTTRPLRSDSEMDEYVFITKAQFFAKINNWDFLEYTNYNNNFYGISRNIDKYKNYVIVLEPSGRVSAEKFMIQNGINYTSVFLDIDEDTQEYRLWVKRRESTNTIRERKKDFLYFKNIKYDYVVNWSLHTEEIARRILEFINNSKYYE